MSCLRARSAPCAQRCGCLAHARGPLDSQIPRPAAALCRMPRRLPNTGYLSWRRSAALGAGPESGRLGRRLRQVGQQRAHRLPAPRRVPIADPVAGSRDSLRQQVVSVPAGCDDDPSGLELAQGPRARRMHVDRAHAPAAFLLRLGAATECFAAVESGATRRGRRVRVR